MLRRTRGARARPPPNFYLYSLNPVQRGRIGLGSRGAPGVRERVLGLDAACRVQREQAAEQVEAGVGQAGAPDVQPRRRRELLAQRVLCRREVELRAGTHFHTGIL